MSIRSGHAAGDLPAYWQRYRHFTGDDWSHVCDAELSHFEAVSQGSLDETIVYVMSGRSDGSVKIGITQKPEQRLRAVQAGMAQVFRDKLEISAFWAFRSSRGARQVEALAHRALAPFRCPVGEWFWVSHETAEDAIDRVLRRLGGLL